MPVEGVALIPRCAECEAHWLPADEEHWSAYLTDDEHVRGLARQLRRRDK
jgi:GTP cyclohydrolase I